MMQGNWGMEPMWFGMFFWIIIFAVIIWAVIRITNSLQDRRRLESSGETPLDIVNKRYAKGEISKEEFEQIKKDLES